MADTNDKRRGSGLFHVDREMLPYKVTFSCFSGAHGAVPLFLPLYLREFGFGPQQIGVVLAQTSVGGLLGGLICGYASPQIISEKNAFTCGLLIKMWLVIIVCLMPTPPATGHCELPPDIVLPLNTSQSAREKSWLFDADVMSTNVVVLAVLVCGLGICYSGNHALVDTLTMNALGQNRRAEYGSQKAVGTLAHGIV
ncbi:uncharacterized protein LOC135476339 [Liolophura sinensis]|uniref:uncharacterized protein LOC135476339 n=1 Tax=Liolophura sinensis TaxID=3198878 RepID=UPI0031596DAE